MRNTGLWMRCLTLLILAGISLHSAGQRVVFFTHSVGSGLYTEGKIEKWFTDYNSANDAEIQFIRRSYPEEPYVWENNPFDYWNIWVKGNCSPDTRGIHCLSKIAEDYDIVVMKHCYTGARIEPDIEDPDITSDRQSIENYKLQYRAVRDLMDTYPDTRFVVLTLTPRHRLRTDANQALRAKGFVDWVKNEWLQEDGKDHDNIFIFDFWSQLAETNADPQNGAVNCLRYSYEKSHTSDNSHPNTLANETVAPVFAQFIVNVATNSFPTGNQNILDESNIQVNYFPDQIEVLLKNTENQGGLFQIIDASGKVVLQRTIAREDEHRIYVSRNNFSKGLYIAKYTLSPGQQSVVQKVVLR